MTKLPYPASRTVDATDGRAGVEFPDPYRWLEEETEEVRAWQRAQADLASGQVRQWPHFDALKERVAHFSLKRFQSLPKSGGGEWFWSETVDEQSQASLFVGAEPYARGRRLFDPDDVSKTRPPFLSWVSPSPDGSVVGIGLCTDGSEANSIRLIDVATGRSLPKPPEQILPDAWMGGIIWLPDSSGFFFQALTKDVAANQRAVYFHDLAAGTQTEQDLGPIDPNEWVHIGISDDSRHAVAHRSMMAPFPFAVKSLPDGDWRPFVTEVNASIAGYILGDDYVAVTDLDAERGRVVRIPLDCAEPNDPTAWETVVPESEAALRTLTVVANHFYVAEFVETYSRIRVFDERGQLRGSVPLPDRGALVEMPFPMMNLEHRANADAFVFAFSSLTRSAGVYRHVPGGSETETLKAPERILENVVVDDYEATSEDGTRIPYHVVRRADVESGPSLLYAYGGFNAPWPPVFPNVMAPLVEAGALFVHCHLRGGGEFGRGWWEGGRLQNKTNCYKDLYAIAEDLAARGLSSHDQMALTGGSNGGMLCGMAITERPDLWAAVLPRVPFLDLLGSLRTAYGYAACAVEFGDPEDPDEIRRMAQFSPYNRVEPGRDYPAVFIDAGDTDPRCPPFHARKFAARLQAANPEGQPVLVHIWENVGHGWATDEAVALEEHTEGLGFVMQHIGLTPYEEKP